MAYDVKLADRIRADFADRAHLHVDEKKMFRGLTFMVNGKMCVSVSGENLMCRFDPALQIEVAKKLGFQTMHMKGRIYKGFCYVAPEGLKTAKNFRYWIELCLAFNAKAKSSRTKKTGVNAVTNFRKLALTFAQTSEAPHFEKTSFVAKKKIFATLDEKDSIAVVKLSTFEQEVFCEADKSVVEAVKGYWGQKGWTQIRLEKAKQPLLRHMLTAAYAHIAGKIKSK